MPQSFNFQIYSIKEAVRRGTNVNMVRAAPQLVELL